ncbi:P-loop containing nucleoside triphosphate hydrolase protein [Ascobolus immersus RN42]|uniref:DNA 3'-5' helicase n=1 Tax=Ascobolus immersus RN42 TaxID=1160509 RepID=A0A3N4HSV0_ASCIM|nr:P-loop containing nucleoside triphosphate hydrolase protein [Ascobolus immersus RN42]
MVGEAVETCRRRLRVLRVMGPKMAPWFAVPLKYMNAEDIHLPTVANVQTFHLFVFPPIPMPPKPKLRRTVPTRHERDSQPEDTASHVEPPPQIQNDTHTPIPIPTQDMVSKRESGAFGDDGKKFKVFDYEDIRNLPVRTGGGKSMIFQLLTAMPDWNIIIISPINALILEQVTAFREAGISCIGLAAGEKDKQMTKEWKDIDDGKFQVIVAAPERLLDQSGVFWHRMLGNVDTHPLLSKVRCIFIDEAHCVHKWGKSNFRADYRGLGKLRPHFTKSVIATMSATWLKHVRYYVHRIIGLAEPTYIFRSPVKRENLSLICAEMQPNYVDLCNIWETVDPDLVRAVESIPKTIVYVDNRRATQAISNFIRESLQPWLSSEVVSSDDDFSSGDEESTPEARRARIRDRRQKELERDVEVAVVSFNAALPPGEKTRRLANFRSGISRIMVATEAAGMGLNIEDVEICIQYGLTDNLGLAEVWQRLGRAARSLSAGTVIILAERKYLLPAPPAQLVGNVGRTAWAIQSHTGPPNFYLPVTADTIAEAHMNVSRIQVDNNDDDTTDEREGLDPHLKWLLGTTGCRQDVLAIVYEDPTLERNGNWSCGKCDNCLFPPRTYFNRAAAPPTDLRGMAAPNFRRIIRPSQTDVGLRDEAITEFIGIRAGNPNSAWLRRSVRYLDTCGHEEEKHTEDVERQAIRDAQEGTIVVKNMPDGLVKRLVEAMKDTRDKLFETDNEVLQVVMGLRVSEFIPDATINRIAEYVASGRAMRTVDDLDTAMGGNWDLRSSGLLKYAKPLLQILTDTTEAFRVEKEKEKEAREKLKEENAKKEKIEKERKAQEKKEAAKIAKAARDAKARELRAAKEASRNATKKANNGGNADVMPTLHPDTPDHMAEGNNTVAMNTNVGVEVGDEPGELESKVGNDAIQKPLAPLQQANTEKDEPQLALGSFWVPAYRPLISQVICDHIAARNDRAFDRVILAELFDELHSYPDLADMIERQGFHIERDELALELIQLIRAKLREDRKKSKAIAPIPCTHASPAPPSTQAPRGPSRAPSHARSTGTRSRNVSETPASPFIGFAPICTPEPDAYFLPQKTEYHFTEPPTTPLRHNTSRSRSQTPLPGSGRAIKLNEWDGGSEKLVDMRFPDAELLGQGDYDEIKSNARDDVLLKKTENSVASQDGARGRRRKRAQSDAVTHESIPGDTATQDESVGVTPVEQEKKLGRTRGATKRAAESTSGEILPQPTPPAQPRKRQATKRTITTTVEPTVEEAQDQDNSTRGGRGIGKRGGVKRGRRGKK